MIISEMPIMPIRRSELAAYLSPGMSLKHLATDTHHDVERVEVALGERIDVVDGKHIITTGCILVVTINGLSYCCQKPRLPHQRHIDQLWVDYDQPRIPSGMPSGIDAYYANLDCFLADVNRTRLDYYQSEAGFTYYPGQRDVIARCACTHGAIIAVETGGGKTLIGISLARIAHDNHHERILLLVPQGVIKQWQDELARFWPDSGVRRLTKDDIDEHTFRVAPGVWLSYHEEFLLNDGGLVAQLPPNAFDVVVMDEGHKCFPAGTMVETDSGPLPIELIVESKMPVTVRSYDVASRKSIDSRVVGYLKTSPCCNLVRVIHEHGFFDATADHRIWTGNAFKAASELVEGDELLALRTAIPVQAKSPEGGKVLQAKVLFGSPHRTLEAPYCGAQNVDTQPDVDAWGEGEDAREGDRAHVQAEGREWIGSPVGPRDAGESTGVANGACDKLGASGTPIRQPVPLLQGRHCRSADDDGDRGGRAVPLLLAREGHGQKEGADIIRARVVRVEVLERARDDRHGECAHRDQSVYCLEVEGTHAFFANGILVSNCQNGDTIKGERLWKLAPRYRYVLTATPITNEVADIYPLCRWVRPDLEFKYTRHKSRIDWRVSDHTIYLPVDPALFSAELMRVVVAVRKIDLRPDLPPITVNVHRVAMPKEHRDIYDFISNDWRPKKGDAGTVARLRMSKQRETCVKTGDFNARNRFVLHRITELHYRGEQVVVGCARTEQSSWLAGELKKLGIKFSRIDSTRAASKHAAEADKFKAGDTQVMLIGVRCAYGYSFPECAHGILASPEWGLGTVIQFYGRFYRLNSNRPVTCDVFICKDTVEEEMVDTLGLKEHAANTVLFGNNHHPIMADSLASVD